MFEIKRKERIYEEVKLGDEVLVIDIDPESVLRRYNQCAAQLAQAQLKIETARKQGTGPTDADYAFYGEAVVSLFNVIFGEDNTTKFISYFSDNYVEMLSQVFPFIQDRIAPKIMQAAESLKKANVGKYKKTRMLPFFKR